MSNAPFTPGIEAAQKALGAGAKIVAHPHPGGAAGVKFSLAEVARRIRRGKDDPMLVAWARRAIHENGGPQDTKGRAQAILTQLRKQVSYVPDPVSTEFMAQPRNLLCLDPNGLCFKGGDCDDLVIAYASACLAVGIPTKIIGEAFGLSKISEHVLCAILDDVSGDWLHVDPSTPLPVGEYVKGTNEEWIDPMAPEKGASALGDTGGNFVGVGAVRGLEVHWPANLEVDGTLGAAATTAAPAGPSALAIVGAVVAAGAIGLLVYNVTQEREITPSRNPIARRARGRRRR
jgi:hypothetical protein